MPFRAVAFSDAALWAEVRRASGSRADPPTDQVGYVASSR